MAILLLVGICGAFSMCKGLDCIRNRKKKLKSRLEKYNEVNGEAPSLIGETRKVIAEDEIDLSHKS